MTYRIDELWRAWGIDEAWHLARLAGGTNNAVWRAETADGRYVLRTFTHDTKVEDVRYEGELLRLLEEQYPPFGLPVHLPAQDGDTIVPFETTEGEAGFATLHPLLPGSIPERTNPQNAARTAEAVAWMDRVMAELPELPTDKTFPHGIKFGEFEHWALHLYDPIQAITKLPIPEAEIVRLQTLLGKVMEATSEMWERLPMQLVHRDSDPGNTLMQDEKVTALLDFEFAGRDLRVFDLCVSLNWWPASLLGTGQEWEIIDAFGASYMRHYPLLLEELDTIPLVMRLRDCCSLVRRLGRYLQGLESVEQVQRYVQHAFWREDWRLANEQKLLKHAHRWKK